MENMRLVIHPYNQEMMLYDAYLVVLLVWESKLMVWMKEA